MNPQISFIMSEADEECFNDFVQANDCILLKAVLFDDELPTTLYECTDINSSLYYVVDKNYDFDGAYIETEIEEKSAKAILPVNDDFSAKPVIEFIRGRFDVSIGRLYANTVMMSPADKTFIKEKYKIFLNWIIKNSNHVIKMGASYNIYLLPGERKNISKIKIFTIKRFLINNCIIL